MEGKKGIKTVTVTTESRAEHRTEIKSRPLEYIVLCSMLISAIRVL